MSATILVAAEAAAPAGGKHARIERATAASRIAMPVFAAIALLAVSMPWWAGRADMRLAGEFLYVLALAQTWNLLAGYGGLISMGQQAFVAIPLCGLIAALVALPTAAVVFRLRGAYLAVGTWVAAEVFRLLITNTMWLGGGTGLSVISAVKDVPQWWREAVSLWIAFVLGAGATAALYIMLRSRFGLALQAIRDSEPAAESVGVVTPRLKWGVYVASAFGCGCVGALAFITKLRVAPDAAFSLDWMTSMAFVVVIGGIGTIEGPILGALIYFGLRALLADYGAVYMIVLGLLAVVVMLKMPEGVFGFLARRFDVTFFPVQRRLNRGEGEAT